MNPINETMLEFYREQQTTQRAEKNNQRFHKYFITTVTLMTVFMSVVLLTSI